MIKLFIVAITLLVFVSKATQTPVLKPTSYTNTPDKTYDRVKYKTYEEFLASSNFSTSTTRLIMKRELQNASMIRKISLKSRSSKTLQDDTISVISIIILVFFILSIVLFVLMKSSTNSFESSVAINNALTK